MRKSGPLMAIRYTMQVHELGALLEQDNVRLPENQTLPIRPFLGARPLAIGPPDGEARGS